MTDSKAAEEARRRAHELYEGKVTPHRSCGVAIAETFGRPHGAYQSLRRGGITGCGECGALVAGRLVLGELLGDPSPTGPVTAPLRAAMAAYEPAIRSRFVTRAGHSAIICDALTQSFPAFQSPERVAFCTGLAADVAENVALALEAHGVEVPVITRDEEPA